jgi:peptidoglycan/xylan/chitin deacetylase (PgdA/CDA1 family)
MRARRLGLIGAAGGAVAWSLPALSPVVAPVADLYRVRCRIVSPDAVALTFDDGPHPQGTPAVLEALAQAGAVATFFLVGEQVQRNRQLAGEIAAAGHGIALHGQRHRNLLRLSPAMVAEDLQRGADAVHDATGVHPVLYRPPYGIFSAGGLAVVRRSHEPLLWSRWGRDWAARATPESIAGAVTRDLAAGDVLLLHDADHYSAPESWRNTAGALPRVLAEIERRGLRTAAV